MNILDFVAKPLRNTAWMQRLLVWSRNTKIINLIENQGIEVRQSYYDDDTKRFAVALGKHYSMSMLDPYRTLDATYDALSSLQLWEAPKRANCSEMSTSEKLYLLLFNNGILQGAPDAEIEVVFHAEQHTEVAHIFFA